MDPMFALVDCVHLVNPLQQKTIDDINNCGEVSCRVLACYVRKEL